MSNISEEIYNDIRSWRSMKSEELNNIPPFRIFPDSTIGDFLRNIQKIKSKEDILKVDGISRKNYDLYGDDLWDILRPYLLKLGFLEEVIKEDLNMEDPIETNTESSKLISLDLEISKLSQDETSTLVEDIKEYLNTISKINRFGVRISNLGGEKIHKNKKGIIKSIKDELKIKHKVELVLIQVGYYIEIIEEDSEFFHEKFGFIIHNGGGSRSYNVSGFPVSVLEKYVGELENLGVNFCVCEQVQDNLSNSVTRKVTYSSINKNILNLIF